jgi:hypothetical protein
MAVKAVTVTLKVSQDKESELIPVYKMKIRGERRTEKSTQ